jgi:hypothetical protein
VGLFANNSGTIKNLTVENVQINVISGASSHIYAGSLVAQNTGVIENIEIMNGSLFARDRGTNIGYLGGIIGLNYGGISDFKNTAFISSENMRATGGIVGNQRGEFKILENLINEANLTSDSSNVGGLIGLVSSELNIDNSSNSGALQGSSFVGGIFGYVEKNVKIESSFNNGIITGENSIGGIVGRGHENLIEIINSTNNANIIGYFEYGNSNFGGLIGSGHSIVVHGSINYGNLTGSYYRESAGGLIGFVSFQATINNSQNNGIITAGGNVGGLIGYSEGSNNNSNTIIYSSINNGNVESRSGTAGGLIGRGLSKVTNISNSVNLGNVSGGRDNSAVGGLVGEGTLLHINTSQNNGDINGNREVGGLVGYVVTLSINNSINNGAVVASSLRSGGLVGHSVLSTNIMKSANFGNVSGLNATGGIIGFTEGVFLIANSTNISNIITNGSTNEIGGIAGSIAPTNDYEETYHYGSITSNGAEVAGTNFGTKVTDLSTFNLAFFTTTLGWDTEIWDFTGLDIANGVYPTLKNMPVVED